jgi:hypothetical protein
MDAMPLESFPSRFAARFTNLRTASVLTSSACGILAMCWIQQALAGFGTSLISQTAITVVGLLALGIGLATSKWLASTSPAKSPGRHVGLLIVLQTIIAATVLLPALFYNVGWATIDLVTGEALPVSPTGQIAALCGGLIASWFVPFVALVVFFIRPTSQNSSAHFSVTTNGRTTIAAAAAVIAMTALSGTFGLVGVALVALVIGFAGVAIEATIALRTIAPNSPVGKLQSPDSAADLSRTTQPADVVVAGASPAFKILPVAALAILCGVLFASLSRISSQLFFASSWQSVLQCSAVIVGAIYARRLVRKETISIAHVLLIAAAWSVAILAAWPAIVSLSLDINSGISTVAIAGTARAIIATLCVLPAGVAVGAAAAWHDHKHAETDQSEPGSHGSTLIVPAMLTAWLCCQWWLVGEFSVPAIIVTISAAFLVVAAARVFRTESLRSVRRPTFAACTVVVLAGPILAQRYDPTSSAKLLFDTAVFIAHQHEARSDILPHLDEGRCIATAEADCGTLTFWRYRGQQLQVRASGLPVSSVSCDTNICTQPSAESLQAILPMVMHEGPTRLLLLGVRSGGVLQTSIAFPLQSIICVEPDQKAIAAVSDNVFSQVTPNPLDDSRVTLQTAEPLLKLRTSPGQADIIIASADQQGVPNAASTITTEFLQTASGALSEGGLYCQPLDYADFGPDVLQVIIETWQSVFSEVAAIEIAPGKLLLVATNSPAGIIRPGIVDRLQRPNVRFALAQTGWDWSTPLRLSVYTDQGLTTAFGEPRGHVSNVSTNRLTCLLPWEVMRWGDKYTAVMEKLGPVAQTLQFTIGEDAYDPDVSNRLAELTEQQELIRDHPDEYWFYRRKVKDRLTKTPQSELVQVKGEEPLHELQENEKRRVDYFKTLGTAAKQKMPGPDDLLAIEEFATPHDPLISLFLHQEVAELATRNRAENFQIELQHRLHRIYFTASSDQAVRNVIASIEILCEYPEAISDDADRADQLDALLQALHDRWHNRGEKSPGSSKIVLNDIGQSVSAIDKAFAELAKLNNARGYSSDQWQARRLALEKSLLRPLQAYRTTLMPHHAKRR